MISQGEGCREDVGGGWQHTRQTLEKSPTSKRYTTWAHILSNRNVFAPRGGGGTAGSNAPGACLVFFFGTKVKEKSLTPAGFEPTTS